MIFEQNWQRITQRIQKVNVHLVAVSKTKPVEDIQALYDLGQRDFGENYVQELIEKQSELPQDIRWHFIGHLQRNKVKYIAPFISLIHTVDSFRLLREINKEGRKNNRTIEVLLQMHIAREESKYGLNTLEVGELIAYYQAQKTEFRHIRIRGLMGMATFTDDEAVIRQEFRQLSDKFQILKKTEFIGEPDFDICSMGMSGDYNLAIEEGSTLIRVGSLIFGERDSPET